MKILDYIIVAVVIVWFLLALRNIRKKKGGCCCSCGHTENVAGQKHAGKKIPAKNAGDRTGVGCQCSRCSGCSACEDKTIL